MSREIRHARRQGLQRFVNAQAGGMYEQALREIRAGQKRTHWIWFIFPQAKGLGKSQMSQIFALSRREARKYLQHPLLGSRLRGITKEVQTQIQRRPGLTLEKLFGDLDAMKFRSSMELFGQFEPDLFRLPEVFITDHDTDMVSVNKERQ